MAIGGQNQTNRLGHGVAGATQIACGVWTLAATGEDTLGEIIDDIIVGQNAMAPFSPFEVRLISSPPGAGVLPLDLRTTVGTPGYPIPHVPSGTGAHPDGLILYLAQNEEAPNTKISVGNSNPATNLDLFVMCLG